MIEIDKIVSPDYDLHNRRDRILSTDEIQQLQRIFQRMQVAYEAAPDPRTAARPLELTVQRAVRIMLSALCRVGELSTACWEHVDFDGGTCYIPSLLLDLI